MMNPGHLQHQQTMTEGSAVLGDETELVGEHDISSVSTISKASSNFTDIDGKSLTDETWKVRTPTIAYLCTTSLGRMAEIIHSNTYRYNISCPL